ncbi:hypothetical protein GCM10023159_01930 [Brevibacterium yomogidense]
MLNRFMLDQAGTGAFFLTEGPAPRVDRDGVQRVDRNNTPVYEIQCYVKPADENAEGTTAKIKLATSSPPTIPVFTEVRFPKGLLAMAWSMEGGRSGVSLSASEVEPVGTTSKVQAAPQQESAKGRE